MTNYPSDAAALGGVNTLTQEARRVLGPTHIVWSCYLGDMTQTKTKIINEMVDAGYSAGWVQAVAAWPSQAQEVILRLLTEKQMTTKQIVEKVGFKAAHVTATASIARKLGFLPESVDRMSNIRMARLAKMAARRKAIKDALENPAATLEALGINKDNRHGIRGSIGGPVAKAAAILRGGVDDQPTPLASWLAVESLQKGAPPTPHQTHPNTAMAVDRAASDALAALPDVDPSKRTVRVTLDLTLEELSDFTTAVAKKRAEEAKA